MIPRRGVLENQQGVTTVVTPSGNQDMAYLTEQGLYFFLARSDKPQAIPMQRWVAGDVLPTIRKTGRYEAPRQDAAPQSDCLGISSSRCRGR